jgi:Flp pilus assembly pilin Flp
MKIKFGSESGQTVLEISLIVAVFTLVIIASIPSLRNSVTGVFDKTIIALNGDVTTPIEEIPEWKPTETIIGTGPSEISKNMAQLMADYYAANKKWPPTLKWDNKNKVWLDKGAAWKVMFDWKYPGQNIDIEMWQRSNDIDGVIYTPNGSFASVEPAPGYIFNFIGKDKNKTPYTLTYNENTGLGARVKVEINPEDMKWYAYMEDANGKIFSKEIDMDTLKVSELPAP